MAFESPSMVAGGDINTASFVKISTAADRTVLQAGAGEGTLGVATDAAELAPLTGASALAANSGDQINVNFPGRVCLLQLGGTVTRGDYLKSDASGYGVTASSTNKIGALALESGVSGELIYVIVLPPASVAP